MKILMKCRTVEVTCNGVTTFTRLDSIADALAFVTVLEKVRVKRDAAKLPVDFVEKLRSHLQTTGIINKHRFERNKKSSERLLFVSRTLNENVRRLNA